MLQDEQQRNLILAIVLSIAVVLGWTLLFPSSPGPPRVGPAPAQQEASVPGAAPAATSAPAAPTREAAVAEGARIAIESGNLVGTLRLTGGRIDDLRLARYRETVDPGSKLITLLSPQTAPDPYFAEFGWIDAAGKPVPDEAAVWTASGTKLTPTTPVTLAWDNGKGLRFERRIAVDRDFLFTVTDHVTNAGAEPVALQPYGRVQRIGTPPTAGYYILHEGPIAVFNGVLNEPSYDDVTKKREIKQTITGGWLGITDKYWLVALVPDQKAEKTARFVAVKGNGKDGYQADYLSTPLTVAPGQSAETVNRLFAGAKEVALLDRYEEELGVARFDRAVDFGWFYWLTKPIFYVLDYFNRLTGNFGVAILLLTLCVKALFFPLANKSYRAMSKMKLLAPEVEKLKARYGEDRQAMSAAMMELYKKSGANPLAGCLPIVIQIPVFFSLYKVLFVTIEMRHAPFYGWIKDLSSYDPTSVFNLFGLLPWGPPEIFLLGATIGAWPLMMGVTMYLQQKLNPAPPDPVQAKVFMALPFIFTIMLAPFPAGLVIYWAWNNLLSVAQQWVIMRQAQAAKATS